MNKDLYWVELKILPSKLTLKRNSLQEASCADVNLFAGIWSRLCCQRLSQPTSLTFFNYIYIPSTIQQPVLVVCFFQCFWGDELLEKMSTDKNGTRIWVLQKCEGLLEHNMSISERICNLPLWQYGGFPVHEQIWVLIKSHGSL